MKEHSLQNAVDNNNFGICVDFRSNFIDNIELAHCMGLRVLVYSPNKFISNLSVLKKNPNIIETDDPISVLKYLNHYKL